MNQSQEYDIIIVGAGLVGASMVVALQNQGLKIAVLETHLPDFSNNRKKDTRPLSLSYGSVVILKTLGVWSDLKEHVCPIKKVHVSNAGALGAIHFHAQEQKLPALGYVVSFSDLQQALYHRAAAQENVDIISITELCSVSCESLESLITVNTIEGKRQLKTSLLIAADGTHSTMRGLLNIKSEQYDYDDIALTADIHLNESNQETAYERFATEGTLAILPMPERHHARLVWTMDKKMLNTVNGWDDEKFSDFLQTSFAYRLPVIKMVHRGASFPLKMIKVKEQIRPGFVLLGNAAHTIYPVAAQGFNLGLRDVAVLAEVLIKAKKNLNSLGNFEVLEEYYDWRLNDQNKVSRLTENITSLFGLQLPLLGSVRGLGMLALDLLLPVKKRMAKQIMGLSGRLPRLARGVTL